MFFKILALFNPNLTIYLIFSSFADQVLFQDTNFSLALKNYKNIRFKFLSVQTYSVGTLLNSWMNREPYWSYSADEVAEVFRMFLLYRYGGELKGYFIEIQC
jgi:hypothetical protein